MVGALQCGIIHFRYIVGHNRQAVQARHRRDLVKFLYSPYWGIACPGRSNIEQPAAGKHGRCCFHFRIPAANCLIWSPALNCRVYWAVMLVLAVVGICASDVCLMIFALGGSLFAVLPRVYLLGSALGFPAAQDGGAIGKITLVLFGGDPESVYKPFGWIF